MPSDSVLFTSPGGSVPLGALTFISKIQHGKVDVSLGLAMCIGDVMASFHCRDGQRR